MVTENVTNLIVETTTMLDVIATLQYYPTITIAICYYKVDKQVWTYFLSTGSVTY